MFRKQIQIIPPVPFRLALPFVVVAHLLCAPALLAQNYEWKVIARPDPAYPLVSVDFSDSLHGVAGGGHTTGFFRTSDGGYGWGEAPGAVFLPLAIDLLDTSFGWAAGTRGQGTSDVARTTDGGRTWQLLRETFNEEFHGVAGLSPTKCVCAGFATDNGYVYDTAMIVRTTDGGNTWLRMLYDIRVTARRVQFVDSLHGYVGTNSTVLYRTSDAGMTWERLTTPDWLHTLYFLDRINGWAAAGGKFYRTTDGGLNWQFLYQVPTPGDSFYAEALCFTDSLYGWAFGTGSNQGIITECIYRTTNAGVTWSRESIGLTSDLGGLLDGVMLDRTHGYAVAADGRVLGYERTPDGVGKESSPVASAIQLAQNYPNPFNPSTTIRYELPHASSVSLKVYSTLGQEVATLVNETKSAGVYTVQFDAGGLASGVYFCRLSTNNFVQTRKLVVLR
jgi:photosystem II stability/assembly factor-like uncharacterized protein